MPAKRTLSLLLLLAFLSPLSACQRGLWADSDPSTDLKINKYYNGDSARATTETRKKNQGMGFGFPTGGGYQ